MSGYSFSLAGADLIALGAGALWWPAQQLLCVSDLHLGKSERHLRRGGAALPPYETRDTLDRLGVLIGNLAPQTVICLGDSFDDDAAVQALAESERSALEALMAQRRWIWITGNHDPAPVGLGGEALNTLSLGPLIFRHIAEPGFSPQPHAAGEVTGHYHPKVRLRGASRPAFLLDHQRLILPAFGTYTGGLCTTHAALRGLMAKQALAILTGPRALPCPMPR